MEYLDIVDENGIPTGRAEERTKVHAEGLRHRTAHVWIGRKDPETGRLQVIMQKRSRQKDSYPGCYDISSAGHVPAGMDYLPSALRELKEELGIEAEAADLQFIFYHSEYCEDVFYGRPFYNAEYSAVYLYTKPVDIETLALQKEEVEEVRWFDYEETLPAVLLGDRKYCLNADEFRQLGKYLKEYL